MALLPRLAGEEEPKIPVHGFMAALGEAVRGRMGSTNTERITRISSDFGLSAEETDQLNEWAPRLLAGLISRIELHDIFILLEDGIYSTQEVSDILRGV